MSLKKMLFGLMGLAVSHGVFAQDAGKTLDGVQFGTQGMDVKIEFYSPSIVRVCKAPQGSTSPKSSIAVVKEPEDVALEVARSGHSITLKSARLRVVANHETGGICFYDADGRELLRDKDYGTTFAAVQDAGKPSFRVRNAFLLDREEPIYGIGQVQDGRFNRRNSTYHLQNENMFVCSPYFMSPVKGYAVYWDNYSISDFVDTPQGLAFESLGSCADYYFIYGGTSDGVIASVRDLTGHAPMLPLWSYGFFQSKERYKTQDESLEVLKKLRDLKIPVDCVVQDWQYWPRPNDKDSLWNAQTFDEKRFYNPAKWADEIHKLNAKLLIVTWPSFGPKTEAGKELRAKGMMLDFDTWPPRDGVCPYDPYDEEARDIFWKHLNKGVYSVLHNDGWWLDGTEPDHFNRTDEDYNLATAMGSYRSVKNAYSLIHNHGVATHQRAQTPDKRVMILTRSGFVGQQRYGSHTWSGDVASTWKALKEQIPAALNFTMMGIPNWNSDIGGFFAGHWNEGGGNRNPEFQELYVRWMQFGAFTPMMRSHGTDLPREIWNFGNRGEWCFDAQEKMIKLRYRLLPYIYSTSWDVSHNDGTFMRPLVMDFPADANTYEAGGEYLFGRSVLVAPVTEPNATEWTVYLPQGAVWWDFWNNEKVEGAQTVNRSVPKDILPLYVRGGSILPFGPEVQYSTEKKWNDLEIRIYPGADGSFTLYEDEFDNYNYEKGMCSTIEFKWDEKNRTLTIADRNGSFPGMLMKRKFNVVLVNDKSGAGDQPMKGGKKVTYAGKRIKVQF